MHITELIAELKISVDARLLARSFESLEYMDGDNIPEDIAFGFLDLFIKSQSKADTVLEKLRLKLDVIPIKIMKTPVIYALYDGEHLTYIGKSVDIFNRLSQHTRTKSFTDFSFCETPRKDLDIIELSLINRLLPRDNQDGRESIELLRRLIHKL